MDEKDKSEAQMHFTSDNMPRFFSKRILGNGFVSLLWSPSSKGEKRRKRLRGPLCKQQAIIILRKKTLLGARANCIEALSRTSPGFNRLSLDILPAFSSWACWD